jgi:DNA-binding GntR family transcriptional regulator
MTLTEQAYEKIRQDIIDGSLAPTRPLRLDNLKARYGIGHSPLREALSRLQSERLVDAAPLKGFTVAPLSLDLMWDAIETRILIETRALRLSIKNGGDAWETNIVSALHALTLQTRRLRDAGSSEPSEIRTLEARHWAFHQSLLAECRSGWLLELSERLYAATERYRHPFHNASMGNSSAPDPQEEHQALADAVIARDTDRSVALLDSHLRIMGEQIELLTADGMDLSTEMSKPATAS